jgi:hypothetical protein
MSSFKASEDVAIERASTLGPPLNLEEPVVEIDRKMTSANTTGRRSEQDDLDHNPLGPGKPVRHLKFNDPANHNHNTVAEGANSTNTQYNQTFHYYTEHNQSLFEPLVLRQDRSTGQQTARINKSKASYRTARLVSNSCSFKWLFG